MARKLVVAAGIKATIYDTERYEWPGIGALTWVSDDATKLQAIEEAHAPK